MHTAISRRISVDRAAKYILSSSEDKTARLWDAATGQLLRIFRVPIDKNNEGQMYSCAISPDGTLAALGGWTGYQWDKSESIYIVNVQTGEIIQRLKGLNNIINDLEFSYDGKYLAAGIGGSGGVYIYNTSDMSLYKKLEGYNLEVYSVSFDPSGRFATGSYDGKIRLYDNNFTLVKEEATGKRPYNVAFNPRGNGLAVGYADIIDIEIRDKNTLAVIARHSIESGDQSMGYNVLNYSLDGTSLIAAGRGNLKIDNQYLKIIRKWTGPESNSYSDIMLFGNSISDIKPLPDGRFAILSTYPALGVIDADGKVVWQHLAGKNTYTANDKSHFMVSFNGTGIGVTPFGKTPLTFDLDSRVLRNEVADYEKPTSSSFGTSVTDWWWSAKNLPAVNGNDITFLEKNERCLSVDIGLSGKQVVLGADYNIYMTDNNGKMIWQNSTITSAVWAVNICSNDKILVAAHDDGTIRWYRMNDGKEILALYLHADRKRWILFTPSGYYDASPGAEDLLGWLLNNGTDKAPSFYPVSRFKDKFYRPDVIDAILEVYYEGDAVKLANQRSNKRPAETGQQDIRDKLPPTVTISSPISGSTISNKTVTINYSVNCPADAPVKSVRVLIDGRPVAQERGVVLSSGADRKATVTVPEQDCTVTLLAENDNGTSPAANLFLKWKQAAVPKDEFVVRPKLYVLAIGVSDYNNPELKLRFAAKDAGDFVTAITKQKGLLYEDVIVRQLLDKNASKDNITDGLDWIQRQTGQKDMAMIFYAGHGVNDNNGIYYMLPVGADLERVRTTCLNFEELKQTVSSIAGKVVVFIDACHSGNVMGEGRRGTTDINSLINELSSTENGAITFTSSTGKEFSLEDQSWGNGAFTKALIEGLLGKAVIAGKNKITAKSLDAYVSERVKEITNGKQHPTSVTPPNVPDFPIAVKE